MKRFWISNDFACTPCVLCGEKLKEYYIPDDIWNKVIRVNDMETDKEYLCIDCFLKALRLALRIEIRS